MCSMRTLQCGGTVPLFSTSPSITLHSLSQIMGIFVSQQSESSTHQALSYCFNKTKQKLSKLQKMVQKILIM